MSINEQIAIAEKRGIAARTPEEVAEALVKEIKPMFGLNKKEVEKLLRSWKVQWANEKFDELVAEGWDENDEETENEALDFAEEQAKMFSHCSGSVQSIMVWTIENNDVEDLLIKINEELNETYKSHLDLCVFDAYGSTVEDYQRAHNDIGSQTVMLVKNITRANADLYNKIYCDVKAPKRLPCYLVLTSPIRLHEGEKEMWNPSMDVSRVALLTE